MAHHHPHPLNPRSDRERVKNLVKRVIGVSVGVEVVEPYAIERSVGKMRRLVDNRPPRVTDIRHGSADGRPGSPTPTVSPVGRGECGATQREADDVRPEPGNPGV